MTDALVSRLGGLRLPRTRADLLALVGRPGVLRHVMNAWPPFLGAGIRIVEIAPDFRRVRVRLARTPLNANYVGTAFGGSLFAMTDPFWMLMAIHNLGPEYVVWDKAAEIDFRSPGRTAVTAEFVLTQERLDEVRALADRDRRALVWFENDVVASDGTVVAHVRKQLYVRRKA